MDVALGAFRHEAFLYADESEFLDGTVAFVHAGLDAGEPVMVVLDAAKIRLLRERLGDRAEQVHFADLALVGRNPGRILHAWDQFAGEHVGAGRPARGIAEPVGPDRSADELVECQHHEQLLNLAFGDGPPWWLMCPYDTRVLPGPVLDEARRSHPALRLDGDIYDNARYEAPDPEVPFPPALDDPPSTARERKVTVSTVSDIREAVLDHARRAGVPPDRAQDLVMAVSELTANSIRHGGGWGVLRSWREDGEVVHQVEDAGLLADPLVGLRLPPASARGGRGLWLVNQLCDLVEIRSSPKGTVVRVHMRRR